VGATVDGFNGDPAIHIFQPKRVFAAE